MSAMSAIFVEIVYCTVVKVLYEDDINLQGKWMHTYSDTHTHTHTHANNALLIWVEPCE